MKVSIIIPHFDRFELLKETIKSVQQQTYNNWEVIIVDDGSNPSEYGAIIQLQSSNIFVLQRIKGIKGPSACRNLGVKEAKGDYLMFLDSDDLILPDCLEKRLKFLENNDHLDFAVFTQAVFSETITEYLVFSKFYPSKEDYLKGFIADQVPWCISGPLWKKSSFLNLDGFREDYKIMEDPELHIRALLKNIKFEVVKGEPDFFYRQSLKSAEQEQLFWRNSIKGRITFYKDLLFLLQQQNVSSNFQTSLQTGIKTLFKQFLLARVKEYSDEYITLMTWADENKLITLGTKLLIKYYYYFSHHTFFSKLPFLKGLLYKLI